MEQSGQFGVQSAGSAGSARGPPTGLHGHEAFENQLAHWQREHPDTAGLGELAEQVAQLQLAYQRVLDLAARQHPNTIEALMGKSDLQAGMEALLGGPLSENTPKGHRER